MSLPSSHSLSKPVFREPFYGRCQRECGLTGTRPFNKARINATCAQTAIPWVPAALASAFCSEVAARSCARHTVKTACSQFGQLGCFDSKGRGLLKRRDALPGRRHRAAFLAPRNRCISLFPMLSTSAPHISSNPLVAGTCQNLAEGRTVARAFRGLAVLERARLPRGHVVGPSGRPSTPTTKGNTKSRRCRRKRKACCRASASRNSPTSAAKARLNPKPPGAARSEEQPFDPDPVQ